MGDLLAQVGLGNLLHLAQDHRRNLLGGESLLGSAHFHLDDGLAILGGNLVGEVLDVVLDVLLAELSANKTPG